MGVYFFVVFSIENSSNFTDNDQQLAPFEGNCEIIAILRRAVFVKISVPSQWRAKILFPGKEESNRCIVWLSVKGLNEILKIQSFKA